MSVLGVSVSVSEQNRHDRWGLSDVQTGWR